MKLRQLILIVSSCFLGACSSTNIKLEPLGFKAKFKCTDANTIYSFSGTAYERATLDSVRFIMQQGAEQKQLNWCQCYLVSLEEF